MQTKLGDTRDDPPLFDTYNAALQHDTVDVPADAWVVGVVRIPMHGIEDVIDANLAALAPPSVLLDEFQNIADGIDEDETTAHNRAYESADFESRYLTYLEHDGTPPTDVLDVDEDDDTDVPGAVDEVLTRLADGQPVYLCCYEAGDKACHRRSLRDHLIDQFHNRE